MLWEQDEMMPMKASRHDSIDQHVLLSQVEFDFSEHFFLSACFPGHSKHEVVASSNELRRGVSSVSLVEDVAHYFGKHTYPC